MLELPRRSKSLETTIPLSCPKTASQSVDDGYNAGMTLDDDACYRALLGRDARFDGLFFVGVKTTGVYCRPVCTAKTPGRGRCRFFASAALAERAGFRPCLRCRPELAPGHAPVDCVRTTARAAAARIEAGALSDGGSLEELAASLGLSSRQLRRSVRKELGVSPVELAQTNRLLLAKRLIAETQLPLVQVAFAAGFESVRRFNALFRSHYRLTPSALRRSSSPAVAADCLRLVLAYRPPLDWDAILRFLGARAIPGVECVTGVAYHRTVCVGEHRGWLSVSPVADRNLLAVVLATALAPALPSILVRLRNLFDLDARPDVITGHLALDPLLAPWVKQQPGLRVPGAFDSFELGMRAILGQQVSVRGASTLAGRFARRFGEAIETPLPCLNRIAPTAETLAAARSATLAGLGLPNARAESLRNLARVVARSEIDLEPGVDPTAIVAKLVELPGIGPWTAEYIAMRALRWPDAFPAGDLGLVKASRLKSAKALEKAAERWRPWRAYAAMHLWESLKAPSK
jgi:AraC family transcriptional regulator of adaptative response / DNA-3-methyladenine glycosylase II